MGDEVSVFVLGVLDPFVVERVRVNAVGTVVFRGLSSDGSAVTKREWCLCVVESSDMIYSMITRIADTKTVPQ